MIQSIVFQPPNHIGLGHISRLLAIALAVRDLDDQVRLPFLIDGHAHGLVEAHGLPHLSVPVIPDGEVATRWRGWEVSEQRRVALDLAAAMIDAVRADLIVFDCFPHRAVLRVAVHHALPIVVCLRKLKDMSRAFASIREHRSLVRALLVPHRPDEVDVPDDLRPLTCFTGPVSRPIPLADASQNPAARTCRVVITGGGGGYPGTVAFYNLALGACSRLRTSLPIEPVLVTGPLFDKWLELRLVDGVRLLPFDPHLNSRIAAADLVICQGGYNTLAEIAALGVPALCIPAERESDDQFTRARDMTSPIMTCYTGSDSRDMADLALALLQAHRTSPRATVVTTPGAGIAARRLLDVLRSGSATTRHSPGL